MKPITIKPSSGGVLMSSLSEEAVGVANYTEKKNMRRYLDRELRAEGFAKFCPKLFDDAIVMPASSEDINLAVMLRHPNGATAVIVGTPTTIWKYSGTEDPLYVEADYVDPDYVVDTASAWKVIGSGFSAAGRRWEALGLNGYLVLNNAVDLPCTYRLTDELTVPIYELRELAVASVGTIAVYNSVLHCFDIRQIKEGKLLEIMAPIPYADAGQSGRTKLTALAKVNSGVVTVAGNIITATNGTFYDGSGFTNMAGLSITMVNGVVRDIASVNSAAEAVLGGDPVLVEPDCPFFLTSGGFDYLINSITTADFAALGISDPVGLKLWWESGESRVVTLVSGNLVYVNDSNPIPNGPILIENPLSYASFTDEAFIDRIQWRTIRSLPDQPRRFGSTYPATVTPTSNIAIFDYPIKSVGFDAGDVLLTGMKSGNLSASGIYFDGIHLMVGANAIRGFYADVLEVADAARAAEASADAFVAQTKSTLGSANDALAKANEAAAASPDDADLASAAAAASAAADTAQKAVTEAELNLTTATTARVAAEANEQESESVEIQLADAVTSISRLDDLQDDGSAILRALPLRNALVVYKETAIFICRQSGTEFLFSPPIRIPLSSALFYRNTLIDVNGLFHIYAAENQFCQFDMTNQVPQNVKLMQVCQDKFFDGATPEDMEKIFACDNAISQEILFCLPASSEVRALAFEYKFNTASTSTIPITAGATVTFPGKSESIFLIGGAAGMVYRFGMVAGKVRTMSGTAAKSGDVVACSVDGSFSETDVGKTIKFANGLRFGVIKFIDDKHVQVTGSGTVAAQAFKIEPSCWHYDGEDYDSVLQGGGDAFGSETSEKKLHRYQFMVSSHSPDTQIALAILSGRNINEVIEKISTIVTPPETLVPALLSDYFISDKITISGKNNPIEITSRIFHLTGVNAGGFGRRAT